MRTCHKLDFVWICKGEQASLQIRLEVCGSRALLVWLSDESRDTIYQESAGADNMKTITVASAKGGTGKSTIASALAVRASQDAQSVVMMDLNLDQGSLTHWWHARGQPKLPQLVEEIKNVPRDVRALASNGTEWLFIDTPPADMDLIEQAVAVANGVLIPVRSGLFDVLAVQPVIEMCQHRKKPFAFVLNAVDAHFKTLTKQTVAALTEFGPLLPAQISYRSQWIQALTVGKTGPELEKDLKPQIDSLWKEAQRLVEVRAHA